MSQISTGYASLRSFVMKVIPLILGFYSRRCLHVIHYVGDIGISEHSIVSFNSNVITCLLLLPTSPLTVPRVLLLVLLLVQ